MSRRRVRLSSIAIGVACAPILCCWIAVASCFCPSRLHRRRNQSEDRQRFERRQAVAPRPLPVRPPERCLTIPPPREPEKAAAGRPQGKTLDQWQSRLMRLPYELRQMIYRSAIGDSTMHMILKKGKLGHLRCKAPSPIDCPLGFNGTTLSRECCWGSHWDSANIWLPTSDDGRGSTDGDLLPLLQTCRQIYSEAIDLVYSSNCFSFSDLDCLRYFSCTVLPRRFDLIRTLDLEWCLSWPIYDPLSQALLLAEPALYPPHDEATWEATWRIIADMPNLRFVRASLLYFYGFRDTACEQRMLAPLRKVTKPQRFEVHVSWQGGEVRDAPFQLFRPAREEVSLSSDEDW